MFSVGVGFSLEQVFRGQAKQAACMIYYSRKDAGTPKISPKAGNMVRWSGLVRSNPTTTRSACVFASLV